LYQFFKVILVSVMCTFLVSARGLASGEDMMDDFEQIKQCSKQKENGERRADDGLIYSPKAGSTR
jgi:hypothetical protein